LCAHRVFISLAHVISESRCFQAGAGDSEEKCDERLKDDLAIEEEQCVTTQKIEERTIHTDEGRDFSGLPSAFQ